MFSNLHNYRITDIIFKIFLKQKYSLGRADARHDCSRCAAPVLPSYF